MAKQKFVREEVYKSEKGGSRTISFVANVYQDKEKIWVVSKEILNPTEINNNENSVNYHPKMFQRLREVLIKEDSWND